jgi:hypothetical protein
MKVCLLDTNVLLALSWPHHVHHRAAQRWFADRARHGWATCATTQLGFVRLSCHPVFTPDPATPGTARAKLREIAALPGYRYWKEPDKGLASSSLDAIWTHVLTHGQVTDGWLVGVASSHGGIVATLDLALQRLFPNLTQLVPA